MNIDQQINNLEEQIKVLQEQKAVLLKERLHALLHTTPEGVKASELFKDGWRLFNWGASLTDTDEEIILVQDGKRVGYWADGSSRSTEEAFALLGLEDNDFGNEVLTLLSELSE